MDKANSGGHAAIAWPKAMARRAQAAIEYIMTYGWAILALVIIIGMLVSSGVLSPTFMVAEECNIGSNLPCRFGIFNKNADTKLGIELYNGFAYKIKIMKLQVYEPASGKDFQGFATDAVIESGSNYTSEAGLGKELAPNTVLRLYANITYVACIPEVAVQGSECSDQQHTISGKITGRVISE